jgi:uncharacterized protein (DUF885 family)
MPKVSAFAALRAEYLKEFLERFPVVATYLGAEGLDSAYAALDGKLRDYSPVALRAERDTWAGFRTRLAKIDVKTLAEPDRIDASVMGAQLAFLVHNLDRRVHEKALDVFLEEPLRGVEWALQGMAPGAGGTRGTKAEWQGVAARTAAVPVYLKTALANVRRGASGNAIPDRSHAASIPAIRWLTPGGVEDSASMWEDSMSSEGWALYCERLVGERRADFPDGFYSPEERFFQLQNQLLRDARVVIDTGIHCGFISFKDAVAYYARNVVFVKGAVSTDAAVNPDAAERAAVASARKEIFRYSKWPTQAITYHFGKADILALREECQAVEGPGFSERRFHEGFLSEGQIPPGTFRARLLAKARARSAMTGVPDATAIGSSR